MSQDQAWIPGWNIVTSGTSCLPVPIYPSPPIFFFFFSWRAGLELDRINPSFSMVQRHFSRNYTDLVFLGFTYFSTCLTPKTFKGNCCESVILAQLKSESLIFFLPKTQKLGAHSPARFLQAQARWNMYLIIETDLICKVVIFIKNFLMHRHWNCIDTWDYIWKLGIQEKANVSFINNSSL